MNIKRSNNQKYITQIERNLENIKKNILSGNYHNISQLCFNTNYKNYLFNLPNMKIGGEININHKKLNYQKLVILESQDFVSNISGYVILILIGGGGSGNYGNGGGSGEINIISCCLEKDKTYKLIIGQSDQATCFDDLYHAISGDQPEDTKYGGSGTCGGGVGASRKDNRRGTRGGCLSDRKHDGISDDIKTGGDGYGLRNTNTDYDYYDLRDKFNFFVAGNPGEGGKSDNSLRNGYPGGGGAGGLSITGMPEPIISMNNHVYSGRTGTGFGAGGSSYFDGDNFINTKGQQGAIIICYV